MAIFMRWFLLLIAAVGLNACAAAVPQKSGQADVATAQNPPSWAGKTWQQGNSYFFSGISAPSDTLDSARQSAYVNALLSVSNYIGITVSNNTSQVVGNDYAGISAYTDISSQKTNLANGQTKDFQFTKSGTQYIGYILLEYAKSDIDGEKQRIIDLQKKKEAEIAARKDIGPIVVIATQEVETMVPALKQFLQSQGYLVGDRGLARAIIKFISQKVDRANPYSMVCFLDIEIDLNGQIFTFTTRGYGATADDAINNARDAKQWLPV
ncbi:MAG: hypothetical protein LBB93_03415, partial [Elusimicrobiota bacterium]|nr:hypothetical protein [Elusimicrobiota bacterium]